MSGLDAFDIDKSRMESSCELVSCRGGVGTGVAAGRLGLSTAKF